MTPIFTISLDFELHWGGFDKWPVESYRSYFMNTRKVIPKILGLFERNQVHATWATVGLLFFSDKERLLKSLPEEVPSYINKSLSAYHYLQQYGIGVAEEVDPLHFGSQLIRQIAQTGYQEIGSHSFAHYYCNEPGQNTHQFRADLKAAQNAAMNLLGKKLRSFVFPRNQFNEDYLRVCCEEGFVVVRDNPSDWFWNIRSTQHESLWKRLNRGLDAYIPIGRKNTYPLNSLSVLEGLPLCLPASRLLRPYDPSGMILNAMKINRIKNEIQRAARKGEVYHLWWHPHNFGRHPVESLAGLDEILSTFVRCRDQYGMQSLTMGETADLVLRVNGKDKAA